MYYLRFHTPFEWLYTSNETECFNYKGGCGVHMHTGIEVFKEELAYTTDKRLHVISNLAKRN